MPMPAVLPSAALLPTTSVKQKIRSPSLAAYFSLGLLLIYVKLAWRYWNYLPELRAELKIDQGPCPVPGWGGSGKSLCISHHRVRVHTPELETKAQRITESSRVAIKLFQTQRPEAQAVIVNLRQNFFYFMVIIPAGIVTFIGNRRRAFWCYYFTVTRWER